MKKSNYTLLLLLSLLIPAVSLHAEECTFNGYNDGPLHEQQGWWGDKGGASDQNFLVADYLGITQSMGDKALVISGSDDYMKISRKKNGVRWKPADTAVFEMDFQFGLNAEPVATAQNGIAILFGEPNLHVSNRLVFSIGIGPDGTWLIRGNMPHWENLPKLPAETFVARSASGGSAISPWFHLKLTVLKDTEPHVFKIHLSITDTDGNVVKEHTFKDAPLDSEKASLWSAETLSYGFSAKDNMNGLVCIDNVNLTVIEGEREVTSLKDLL